MPRQTKKKQQRIDAAYDRLGQMGFTKSEIKKTIHRLLEVYGSDAWIFLEEDNYKIVVEALLEEKEEEEQKKGQEAEEANFVALTQECSFPVVPLTQETEVEKRVVEVEQTHKRPPCYGWISETESDSGEEDAKAGGDHTSGGLCQGRKRPSRWDVPPSASGLPST